MTQLDRFAGAFLDAAPDAFIGVDDRGQIVLANKRAEKLLGYRREELWGKELEGLITDRGLLTDELQDKGKRSTEGDAVELAAHRRDGSVVPVEVTLTTLAVDQRPFTILVLRDLTDRRRLEAHLLYLSTHDTLTGLSNRGAFDLALARLDACGPHPIGVLMIAVEGLKQINDQRGHSGGDGLLKRVAQVLRSTFRSNDVVARIGGVEFAVMAPAHDLEAMESLAQRLISALTVHNRETVDVALSLSVGTSVAEAGTPVIAALQRADAKLNAMKRGRAELDPHSGPLPKRLVK